LKHLMEVLNELTGDRASALSLRIDKYLEEAEELKKLVKKSAEAPEDRRTDHSEYASEASSGRARASEASSMPPSSSGRSSKEQADGGLGQASEKKLNSGEAMMQEGEALEKAGRKEEAYKTYCEGMKLIMEVMTHHQQHPQCIAWKSKLTQYITHCEKLKPKGREPAQADGKRGSSRDRRDRRDDRGYGRRDRSRSRDRRQRSQSRGRGRRSRSKSRRRDTPIPRARGASPPAASQAEATRPKGMAASRPPSLDTSDPPQARPKSGQALLVGKAKAAARH